MEEAEVKVTVKKSEKKRLFIIIGIVAALAIIIGAVFLSGGTERKLQKQLDLGQKYIDELDYEQALASYLAAIEIDPMCSEAYIGAADAYIGMEDLKAAEEILQQGYEVTGDAEIQKKLAETQVNLGREYLNRQDYERALECFMAAIEIDSKNLDAYIGASDAYMGLEDYDSAEEILEQGSEAADSERIQEKLAEVQAEIERIAAEEEERKKAEEEARKAEEEKARAEAALKPLYDMLAAGEEDETIVEYVMDNNLMDVEGSYSLTGDVENGIVLDKLGILTIPRNTEWEYTCFFYGEKTNGSYETTGNWYCIYGRNEILGLVEYSNYEGGWKNGMPNGEGMETYLHFGTSGEQDEACAYWSVTTCSYKDGYADGSVKDISYYDITNRLPWNDIWKSERNYVAENKRIAAGTYEYYVYYDDGTKVSADFSEEGEYAAYILGPWTTE